MGISTHNLVKKNSSGGWKVPCTIVRLAHLPLGFAVKLEVAQHNHQNQNKTIQIANRQIIVL